MIQPNLAHLTVFAAVARHGSFRKAGAEAGMSTSAVSHAIRGLEELLGVSLFNRTTRSVALTDAGQRLLERLHPVLRDVRDAIDEMNNFRRTATGTLRINTSRGRCTPTTSSTTIASAIALRAAGFGVGSSSRAARCARSRSRGG